MTINAVARSHTLTPSFDNKMYSEYPNGDAPTAWIAVHPIASISNGAATDGFLATGNFPNTEALYRVLSVSPPDSGSRWEWFTGGAFNFDGTGTQSAEVYSFDYEVDEWGVGENPATATFTITIS